MNCGWAEEPEVGDRRSEDGNRLRPSSLTARFTQGAKYAKKTIVESGAGLVKEDLFHKPAYDPTITSILRIFLKSNIMELNLSIRIIWNFNFVSKKNEIQL